MGRAPCCDKTKVKRGPWSPEEDTTLKNYVEKYGTGGNWITFPQKAGLKRCGKSCRLRWLNYLRPDIKHGGFTHEEDNIILTLYHNIGSRWSIIASHLPGRTDNDVKNYWNTKLKKKLLTASTTSPSTSNNNNLRTTSAEDSDFYNMLMPFNYDPFLIDQEMMVDQIPIPEIGDHQLINGFNFGFGLMSQEAHDVVSSTTDRPLINRDNLIEFQEINPIFDYSKYSGLMALENISYVP
ncbi:hypothetical protein RD792_014613 [Penstemon davidsonii]|uniref:Uncharacterized protein n=1 Tax=Penstemon davidsonii TaxID=160366 RepID=A0ABR0CQI6_9LAMI|nr:hypothetical protein RD792_014613 [Penstemon davidsonii]